MADSISSIRIPDLLESLREGEYLIPQFQREFVWSTADVISLLTSIIDSRPIGMLTLWEQSDNSGLDLEHISVPDGSSGDNDSDLEYFGDKHARVKKAFAVLDGRQRSTAIAMAFGGLRPQDARRKFAGKYFLNVAAVNPINRIVFKKTKDIENQKLDVLANSISAGLFPLEVDHIQFPDMDKQWMFYSRSVSNPKFYSNGELPSEEELEKRIAIIDNAFNGIIDTYLAVYTVPKKYDLGTICEIFETLNTTGTRVSTVDLIHSWLYSDTSHNSSGPLLLRDWINDLGNFEGVVGWASTDKRPELIAQIVTACYLAECSPPPARKYGGKDTKISTVKSGDLLATPSEHWENIINKQDSFAEYIGEFQKCVAGAFFPLDDCPYPILVTIYVALRWTKAVDNRQWHRDDIDTLFSIFFWRTTITSRYDQGVITKMASDLSQLIMILDKRASFNKYGEWLVFAKDQLSDEATKAISKEKIVARLLEPKSSGAAVKALMLPVRTRPKRDLLNPSMSLEYGASSEQVQIHHIYPKDWIRNNINKETKDRWNSNGEGHMDCIANLTPMTRSSNLSWKAKVPGYALLDKGVSFEAFESGLASHYITETEYGMLIKGGEALPQFWKARASLIAVEILSRLDL